jgi:hypothetical protein
MRDLLDDKTVSALRLVCDCHFDEIVTSGVVQGAEHFPRQFIREIVARLPDGLVERVSPSTLGANRNILTIRVSPLFNAYVAETAQHLHSLLRHVKPL